MRKEIKKDITVLLLIISIYFIGLGSGMCLENMIENSEAYDNIIEHEYIYSTIEDIVSYLDTFEGDIYYLIMENGDIVLFSGYDGEYNIKIGDGFVYLKSMVVGEK